jgi:hypothetical protein
MKKVFILFVLFVYGEVALSQTSPLALPNTWASVNNNGIGVSFYIPANYQVLDTLNMSFYASLKDSIAIEMHYVNTNLVNFGELMPTNPPNMTPIDTLDKFVEGALFTTAGTLLSKTLVTHNNGIIKGYEVEINFTNEANEPSKLFHRYYWFKKKLFVFSTEAKVNFTSTLINYKNTFFESIAFF